MSYSIVKADLKKHKKAILNIWKNETNHDFSKRYKWIYEGNTSGKAEVYLVRHDDSQHFVGCVALFPASFCVEGVTIKAGIAGDFLVQKEHRTAGPALQLIRAILSSVQEDSLEFIISFPNKASEPILKRAGFKVLGKNVRFVKILTSKLIFSKLGFGDWTYAAIGPFANCVMRAFSFRIGLSGSKKLTSMVLGDFDERFESIWKENLSEFIVLKERTVNYMNWKFRLSPYSINNIFAVFNKDKDLQGYVIYRINKSSIEVRDFASVQEGHKADLLWAYFTKHARALGADSIGLSFIRNDKLMAGLSRQGFIERKEDHIVYVAFSDQALRRYDALSNYHKWLIMQSNNDM